MENYTIGMEQEKIQILEEASEGVSSACEARLEAEEVENAEK